MPIQHKTLAAGRWYEMSAREQLGNVGSEIHRAILWKENDEKKYHDAITRALELIDLTMQDPRWRGLRIRELCRAREMLCDAVYGISEYKSTLEDLDNYFFAFAYAARLERERLQHD